MQSNVSRDVILDPKGMKYFVSSKLNAYFGLSKSWFSRIPLSVSLNYAIKWLLLHTIPPSAKRQAGKM